MKKILLLSIIGTIIIISCNEDYVLCTTDNFSPNKYKYFLPYDLNEKVIFLNENGNKDTLVIEKYELVPNSYSTKDCSLPSESINVEMILNYNSHLSCRIKYQCTLSRLPPYLVLSSTNCNLQATYESINQGNGTLKNIDNYKFEQFEYDEVIEVKFTENAAGLDEIVLAKNIGFVYIKIDNTIRIPIK